MHAPQEATMLVAGSRTATLKPASRQRCAVSMPRSLDIDFSAESLLGAHEAFDAMTLSTYGCPFEALAACSAPLRQCQVLTVEHVCLTKPSTIRCILEKPRGPAPTTTTSAHAGGAVSRGRTKQPASSECLIICMTTQELSNTWRRCQTFGLRGFRGFGSQDVRR